MTSTTKRQHEKDKERDESPAWSRCPYCDTRIHEQESVKGEEGRYCDEDHLEWHNAKKGLTSDQELVKKHLKDRFLDNLSVTRENSVVLKRAELRNWKNGEVDESTIKRIALKIGKSPKETEKLVYEVLNDVIENLEEEFDEEWKEQRKEWSVNISEESLKPIVVKAMKFELLEYEDGNKFLENPEKVIDNWEAGNWKGLREDVAQVKNMKEDNEHYRNVFDSVKKEALEEVKDWVDRESL